MSIKYHILYLLISILLCSATAYNPTSKHYKEVSMLANEMLKNLVYAHYENPNKTTSPQRTKKPVRVGGGAGTKFQQGGTIGIIDHDLIRRIATERIAAREAAKRQEAKQKAEQAKADILIFGTIGLVLLFFIIATITFCILYTKRNKNNPYTSKY